MLNKKRRGLFLGVKKMDNNQRKSHKDDSRIEELVELYSRKNVETPGYLKDKIWRKITEIEKANVNPFKAFFTNLRHVLSNNGTPVLALSFSLFVVVVFLISLVMVFNNDVGNPITPEYASSVDDINDNNNNNNNIDKNVTNSLQKEMNIYSISSPIESNTNKETVINVNGEVFTTNKHELVTKIHNNFNSIRVVKGTIKIDFDYFGSIIVTGTSSFNLDLKFTDDKTNYALYINGGDFKFIPRGIDAEKTIGTKIETPSAIIRSLEAIFNVSVFDNGDTIVSVKDGSLEAYSNIMWGENMTQIEIDLLRKFLNQSSTIGKGNTDLFLMSDIVDTSKYISKNYDRLISDYIR